MKLSGRFHCYVLNISMWFDTSPIMHKHECWKHYEIQNVTPDFKFQKKRQGCPPQRHLLPVAKAVKDQGQFSFYADTMTPQKLIAMKPQGYVLGPSCSSYQQQNVPQRSSQDSGTVWPTICNYPSVLITTTSVRALCRMIILETPPQTTDTDRSAEIPSPTECDHRRWAPGSRTPSVQPVSFSAAPPGTEYHKALQ